MANRCPNDGTTNVLTPTIQWLVKTFNFNIEPEVSYNQSLYRARRAKSFWHLRPSFSSFEFSLLVQQQKREA